MLASIVRPDFTEQLKTKYDDRNYKLHVAYGIEWAVDYADKTFYIYMDDMSLGADFTAHVTIGTAPLTVNFTDQSCGTITSWQ